MPLQMRWRMMRVAGASAAFVCFVGLLASPPTLAEVVELRIDERADVLDGMPFGESGSYEKLHGEVRFAWDPAAAQNAAIVDIELAPRSRSGRVEATANFMVLQPKHARHRRQTALLEVSNRGGMAAPLYFNQATASQDPDTRAHFGSGLLQRLGLTLIWIGWQHDVPEEPGLFRLDAPVARSPDGPIEGLVRSDWTVDAATEILPLSHRNHIPYPVFAPHDPGHRLTARDSRLGARRVVGREAWAFTNPSGDAPTHLAMSGGFGPGKIYELVYRARDPKVVGLGLAAVRDMMSYAKHDPASPFSAERAIAFGVSQTGRFLRHFLYQGFNVDEHGRKVFDGMLIHTAGAGRGSFNHRFAQPSRDAHRYATFFYPTDIFPFTSRAQLDAVSGRRDGLLAHTSLSQRPKVMYTNTGYEYWGRAAALIHTSVDGTADVTPLEDERIYHIASAQHFVGHLPRASERIEGTPAYFSNPLDLLYPLRALLVALIDWVEQDRSPPESAYPKLDEGTLVPVRAVRFPRMSGMAFPRVAHEAYRVDYGPRFEHGIIDRQPPEIGRAYPVHVPQVDALGNEQGGLRSIELRAPIATYTPWSLRLGAVAARAELVDYWGYFIPLPRTIAQAREAGDARAPIEALYRDKAAYLTAVEAAADDLVRERLLLPEDVATRTEASQSLWDWVRAQ